MATSSTFKTVLSAFPLKWDTLPSSVRKHLSGKILGLSENVIDIAIREGKFEDLLIYREQSVLDTFVDYYLNYVSANTFCAFGQNMMNVEITESFVWISRDMPSFLPGEHAHYISEGTNIGFAFFQEDEWKFRPHFVTIPISACGSFVVLEKMESWNSRPSEMTFERLSVALKEFAQWAMNKHCNSVPYNFFKAYAPKALIQFGQHATKRQEICHTFVISQGVFDFLGYRKRTIEWTRKNGKLVCATDFPHNDFMLGEKCDLYISPRIANRGLVFEQCLFRHGSDNQIYKLSNFFTFEDFKEILRELSAATAKWISENEAKKTEAFEGLTLV